jgi:hypothetical protein
LGYIIRYMEITMGAGKAAKLLGVSVRTLQRWERAGRLCPHDQGPALPRKPSGGDCGWKKQALRLQDREWICPQCGTRHDRDLNAALNLKRLATATALPVASPSGDGGTAAERIYAVGGKVTPVRYEGVSRTRRGRKRTVRTFAHVFDSRGRP